MSIDQIITALKVRAFDRGVPTVAAEVGISDDSLRRILSDDPPAWLSTMRKLEEVAAQGQPAA